MVHSKIQFLSISLTHLCLNNNRICTHAALEELHTYSPHRPSTYYRVGTSRRRKLISRFSGKLGIVLADYSSRHTKILASNIHRDNFLVGSETMTLVKKITFGFRFTKHDQKQQILLVVQY